MRIATYNVNGINGRLPVLLQWLEQTKPDAVCLQELKAPDEKFPVAAIREAGYEAVWQGQKSWNGVAILGRGEMPKELRRGLPADDEDAPSRYIEALVKDVHIACLYLPNGNPAPGPKYDYKLQWIEKFKQHAATLFQKEAPVVMAGDYNMIPAEIDAYKWERWVYDALFLPEVRAAYQDLLNAGWTDALRKTYGDKIIYTFFDYFRNAYSRNAGLRIDHLLLNKPMGKRFISAGVDHEVRGWEKTSDHVPVWIDVKDKS